MTHLEDVIRRAIGYELVPLSIRNHPEIKREFRTAEDADGLVERISKALEAEGYRRDSEHIIQLSSTGRRELIAFLQRPNGSYTAHERLSVDSVEGGGVLIRSKPFRAA